MSRILRNISNSKANKRVLTSNIPARKEGLDGEERVAKITNKGVRLYRKELGQWWYTQFQQSEEADKITIGVATALTLGTVKIGNGLSITSSGTLSTDGSSANYYLDGITKNSNTLTFSVNGATNKSYTFGANAFNSTSIPTNNNQLTNGAGFLTAVATSNIADEAVTLAKIQHVATDIFLGRTSNGTGDVESMSVSDVNVLLSLDNYLTSISTINADKITAGTLPDARIQASGVTQHVGSIVHDSLSGFVANEHLDWTSSVGTIHANNYTDTNTNQLTKFYFVDDDGDAIHPSHDNYIKFMNGNGITTNWNSVEAGGGINDPYILTITSTTVGTVTTVGVSTPITGGISQNGATGTIGHSNDAGNTHVPTTASKDGKFLKATSNNGKSEAWTDITENDITDLGTYLTTSQASSAYLTKSSPQLTTATTLSMNNAKISARTSAGGASDGLGTAGQVLHSHASGGGVYWGTIASTPSVNIYDGDINQVNLANKWMKFVEGNNLIDINFTDTSDGATDDPYDLTFTINSGNITSVGTLTGLSVDGGTSSLNRGNSSGDILDVRGQNTSQMKVTTTAFTVTPNATFTGQVQLDADNADLKLKSGGSGDAQIGFWDGSTNKAYLVWDRSDNRIELNTALDFEVQTNLITTGSIDCNATGNQVNDFAGGIYFSGTDTRLKYNPSNSLGNSVLDVYNSSATGYGAYIQAGSSGRYCLNMRDKDGTERFVFDGGGTATIKTGPVVINSAGSDGQIYFGGTSGTNRMYVARSGGDALLWNVTSGNLKLGTNNALALTIDSSQNATFAGGISGTNLTLNSTSPLKFTSQGTGTYNRTEMYHGQNSTSGNNINGVMWEMGRLTDSSSAEIRKFAIGDRGGGIHWICDGSGNTNQDGDVTAYYSDARLKDFHGVIENPLDKVMKLNGYYFTENAKAKELGFKNDRMQVGVSAQEIEEVLPELIKDAPIGHGYKTIDYGKITPLLIEAIKELKTEINELRTQIGEA
jgi:hypothetical protein